MDDLGNYSSSRSEILGIGSPCAPNRNAMRGDPDPDPGNLDFPDFFFRFYGPLLTYESKPDGC